MGADGSSMNGGAKGEVRKPQCWWPHPYLTLVVLVRVVRVVRTIVVVVIVGVWVLRTRTSRGGGSHTGGLCVPQVWKVG